MDFIHALTIAFGIYWGLDSLGSSIKKGLVEAAGIRAAGNVAASVMQPAAQPQDGENSPSAS